MVVPLDNIADSIGNFFTSFWDKLKQGFTDLFVPDADYWGTVKERFSGRVFFLAPVKEGFDYVTGRLFSAGSTVPSFTLPGANTQHIHFGSTTISLGWYSQYKSTGDTIISAFIIITFVWNLFKRLPDIISGAGMITTGAMRNDNRRNNDDN